MKFGFDFEGLPAAGRFGWRRTDKQPHSFEFLVGHLTVVHPEHFFSLRGSLELFPNKVSRLWPVSDRATLGAVGDRPERLSY